MGLAVEPLAPPASRRIAQASGQRQATSVERRVDHGRRREELGITGVSLEMNPGGQVPYDRVVNAIRLLADKVIPKFK